MEGGKKERKVEGGQKKEEKSLWPSCCILSMGLSSLCFNTLVKWLILVYCVTPGLLSARWLGDAAVEFFTGVPGGKPLHGESWRESQGGKGSNSINDQML